MSIRYAARSLDAPGSDKAPPLVWSNTLVTHYETDPDLLASVLPQPLEPPAEPLVRVNVARVDLPGLDEPLGAGVVSVACRHEGQDGYYDLIMVMTAEQAVIGGRETYGEPKKIGAARLDLEDAHVHGTIGRRGVDFVEVDGTVVEELEPLPTGERVTFYFKFLLDPQGKGFDHDPSLVYCTRTETQRRRRRVDASVVLADSRFDPVADLPVRGIASCYLSEITTIQRGEIHGTVPESWVLPFAHQRYDHLMMNVGG